MGSNRSSECSSWAGPESLSPLQGMLQGGDLEAMVEEEPSGAAEEAQEEGGWLGLSVRESSSRESGEWRGERGEMGAGESPFCPSASARKGEGECSTEDQIHTQDN